MKKNEVKFTTWEKYQFNYLERTMKKKLSVADKCMIIIRLGWRDEIKNKKK